MSGTYMTQNRTQWHVSCPTFWIYMTQNRAQWHVSCPIFIPIGHGDMFSVRHFGFIWLKIWYSDMFPVRYLFQSDTVTCFLFEIWIYMTQNRTQWRVICPRTGHPSPVTIKYVIMGTRDVSFINISSLSLRSVANRVLFFFNLSAMYFCRSWKPWPCCACPWCSVWKPELDE